MKKFFIYPLFCILLSIPLLVGCDDDLLSIPLLGGCDDEKTTLKPSDFTFTIELDEGYFSDDIVIKMESGETLDNVKGFLTLTGEKGEKKTIQFMKNQWYLGYVTISTDDSVTHIKRIDMDITSTQGHIQYQDHPFKKK